MDGTNAPKLTRNAFLSLSLVLASATMIVSSVAAQDAEPVTRIVTDTERATITFIVDGETVGAFNKDGFVVYGDVYHAGSIQNSVPEPVKDTKEVEADNAQ